MQTHLSLRAFYFGYFIISHAFEAQLSPYSIYKRYKEFPRQIWDIKIPLNLNNGIIHVWMAHNAYWVLLMTITSYLSLVCMIFGVQVELMSILCFVSLIYMHGVCGLIQQRWHSLDMACISMIWMCLYFNNVISINACDFLICIGICHSYLSSGYHKIIHSGLFGWIFGNTLKHTIIDYKSIWFTDSLQLRHLLIGSKYSRPLLVFSQLMTMLLECVFSLLLLVLVASTHTRINSGADYCNIVIVFVYTFCLLFHFLIWLLSGIIFSGHIISLIYLILTQLLHWNSNSDFNVIAGINVTEWCIIIVYTCLLLLVTIRNDEFYPLSSYAFFVYDCSKDNKESYPKK